MGKYLATTTVTFPFKQSLSDLDRTFTASTGTNHSLLLLSKHYLFEVNSRNTRTRYEIFSKLTIKIPERHKEH